MATNSTPRTITEPTETAPSHPYTCNSCQVAFRNGDLQRNHMRTDWHRYNLKRRVASLPPISAEVFAEKVLTAQASSTAVAAKVSYEKACSACQKLYYSQNAFENHLKSQRHRLKALALVKDGVPTEDGETGSVISSTISLGEPINGTPITGVKKLQAPEEHIDPEAEAEFSKVIDRIKGTKITEELVFRRPTRPHHLSGGPRSEHPSPPEKGRNEELHALADPASLEGEEILKECLFCHTTSSYLEQNISHMSRIHGLFIPEKSYLTNLPGFFRWLWQRIHEEPHECLYCHKIKNTAEAVQGHMRDLGHCKIAFEEEVDMIEVGQFYDFSSTYSDDEHGDEHSDRDMVDGDANDDGWQDDSDVDSEAVDGEIQIDGIEAAEKRGPKARTLTENQAVVLDDELHLPSGKIAGRRSLAKCFRQNLRDHPSPAERLEQQKLLQAGHEDIPTTNGRNGGSTNGESGRGRQLISRADGGLGMLGVTDAKRRHIQAVEKRDTKRAQRAEKQYKWGVNKRANNQRHFRDPLLQ